MNYSSLESMPGNKDDNAARKYGPHQVDTGDVDAGWDAPEKKEKNGKNDFLFIEPKGKKPDIVREEVRKSVSETTRTEVTVSAEDSFRSGQVLLLDILDKNDVEHPLQMHLLSGANEKSSSAYMVFEKSGALYAKTSPGQTPTNHDGIMASYDEGKKRLRLLLAHGPQHDEQAANLATTAAVKGAFEEASNPEQSLSDISGKVYRNIESVKDEFGITPKKSDVLVAELVSGTGGLLHELSVDNMGLNHCFVIDPVTSSVRSLPSRVKYPLRRGDIETMYKRLETRSQELGKNPTHKDMQGMMLNILEKEVMTKEGNTVLREYIADERATKEPTPEQFIDILAEYFEKHVITKEMVEPGEIVVIANDELMKIVDTERGGYDHQMGNHFLTKLAIPERGLRQVCDEIVEEATRLQSEDQLEDSSLSIVAFEVPVADPHFDSN